MDRNCANRIGAFALCAAATIGTSGCCALMTRGKAFGRLEGTVLFSDWTQPNCISPRQTRPLHQDAYGGPLDITGREVYADHLNKGIPNRSVYINFVDENGNEIDDNPNLWPPPRAVYPGWRGAIYGLQRILYFYRSELHARNILFARSICR